MNTVGMPEKILAIHLALDAAAVPHAFGGALALAWCVQRPRGTADIDVNVFLPSDSSALLPDVLPDEVTITDTAVRQLRLDGQARLWWGTTPVDVFLNTTAFHEQVSQRIRFEPFGGHALPFLDCSDLAVFKAFFDRSKDWVDLEETLIAGTVDVDRVIGTLVRHLGGDDPRIERLRALAATVDDRSG